MIRVADKELLQDLQIQIFSKKSLSPIFKTMIISFNEVSVAVLHYIRML